MDMVDWRAQGFDPDFAKKQRQVVEVFTQMGVDAGIPDGAPNPTCTPYLIGNRPEPGAHVAWAESSAVSFANSVLGARTNREGGPGAVAAALVGRTGAYGLHLDENRRATLRVEVHQQPETISDYSALGALVGGRTRKDSPYYTGLDLAPDDPLREEKLKAMGAAMAATGAVALYHALGITPEAGSACDPDLPVLVVDDLTEGYAALSDDMDEIDLIWIGCPHASAVEIARVAAMVQGKTLRAPLWVTCARPVREAAEAQGLVATIEAAGGRVFADACMAIAPMRDLGFTAVATPSAKAAYYLRNLAHVKARFGPLAACIEAAIRGKWQHNP
jgi:hypothetical protein